jgi:nucleoside-diphosphate-sugar epimerase
MANRTLFVLGATGFIGKQLVAEAVEAGWAVRALTRSAEKAGSLESAGAKPIQGSAENPAAWSEEAAGATALIDLVQPSFPRRLGRRAVAKIAARRQETTRGVLEAIGSLPTNQRPLLIHVSGADELEPDEHGVASERSQLVSGTHGFASIGVPVRRMIERSGLDATYVYFGAMVYGPGKVYADVFVEGMKKHRTRVLGRGDNHLPLTHVTDAARALVHVAGLQREQSVGRTWVAADGSDTTQRELVELTADGMGRKRPGSIPAGVAALVAGGPAVETMTEDLRADPAALLATGFEFTYSSPREGIPATLRELGELKRTEV